MDKLPPLWERTTHIKNCFVRQSNKAFMRQFNIAIVQNRGSGYELIVRHGRTEEWQSAGLFDSQNNAMIYYEVVYG